MLTGVEVNFSLWFYSSSYEVKPSTINPERTRLSSYINQLRIEGYSTLKDIHFESQRTNFPLLGSPQPLQPGIMSQVELQESEYDEDDDDDDSQTSDPSEVEKAQESEGESEPINRP